MAQGDPKLPARPGYITRKSGYSNIRIKDVYAPGTGQNPVLGEFVNFSASLAKKLARDKQLEQSEAKSYLASRRAKLQKQNEDRDRASAEAHHLSAVGTFREAVNNKDIHATQTPIWWQYLAEISGTGEAEQLIQNSETGWAKMVQEGHSDTLDPHGYKSYFNNIVTKFTEDNSVDNVFYTSRFLRGIQDHALRSFGPNEAKARERNFIKASSEGIDYIVLLMKDFAAADDGVVTKAGPPGFIGPPAPGSDRKVITGKAAERLQQLYDMAVVNPVFMENLGKELVDAIEVSEDPEAAEEYFKSIQTHDGAKLWKIKSVEAYWNSRDLRIKGAQSRAQKGNNLRFWSEWGNSLRTIPSDLARRHRHNNINRKDSLTELNDWFENQNVSLSEHFGRDVKDDSEGTAEFENARINLLTAMTTTGSILKNQEQLKITTDPNLAKMKRAMKVANQELNSAWSSVDPKDPGIAKRLRDGTIAGQANYQSFVIATYEQVELLIDPTTVSEDEPDGIVFTKTKAKEWVDNMLYEEFFVQAATMEERAVYASFIALNNDYIIKKLGTWMNLRIGTFTTDAVFSTEGTVPGGINQSPWERDPLTRNLKTLTEGDSMFAALPKDAYEGTLEDIKGSEVLEAFGIYTHLRNLNVNAKKILALSDDSDMLFESAFYGSGKTLAHRLFQASKRDWISNAGGARPLTAGAMEDLRVAVEGYGVTPRHMDIVSTTLQSVWDKLAYGMSDVVATANLEEWASDNIKGKEGVYLRIGSINNFPTWQPKLGLDEEGFFEQFASDIAEELGWPKKTRLSHAWKEPKYKTTNGIQRIELFAISMHGKVLVIPQLVNTHTGEVSDLLDYGIKGVYSGDDLKYMQESYVDKRDKARQDIRSTDSAQRKKLKGRR